MRLRLTTNNLIDGSKLFFDSYLKGYRDRVQAYYSDENIESEAFKFMEPVMTTLLVFASEIYFIFSKADKDELSIIVATDEQNNKLIELARAPIHKKEEYILKIILGINDIIELITLRDIGLDASIWFNSINHKNLPKQSCYWGEKKADRDFDLLQFEKAFIKATVSSSSFPLFELDSIFSKVTNEQFKYELEEAVRAYNSGLFLASTITAAVSLETLLKLAVICKLGEDYLPKKDNQKYTLNYSQILLDNNKIDERLNHRIRSINELRRGGAHSKTGVIEQWDAEQVISGIKIIVEAIFTN